MTPPPGEQAQGRLLRALFNVRPLMPADVEFLQMQVAYLREEIRGKDITDYRSLSPVQSGIYLLRGGHYHAIMRCDRQRSEQCYARLFLPESRVH